MPTPGLSLVGFMDQVSALAHLKLPCVPDPGKDDTALTQDWTNAQAQLGPPILGAGFPNIVPINNNEPHILDLIKTWGANLQQYLSTGAFFAWVEAEKLLAFQFSIDKTRSNHHCGHLSTTSPVDDLMKTCLPLVPSTDNVQYSNAGQSITLLSRSLNLGLVAQGPLPEMRFGVQLGWNLPFAHVVEYNGRCFLHNGFHRSLGVRLSGHTHVPCLFRKVATAEEAGIKPDGSTFSEAVLTSSNPPTLGHFAQGRAYDVNLRVATRVINISWSQHTMFIE